MTPGFNTLSSMILKVTGDIYADKLQLDTLSLQLSMRKD